MNARRVRAILRKETMELRRNRHIVVSMGVLPLVFSLYPAIQIFALPASAADTLAGKQTLVYMLAIPAIVPATIAAYAVAGERQQGTLEPVLTTPVRADEFLLGKALAALFPSLLVSYAVFGIFVAAVELLAHPAIASVVLHPPEVVGQILFTPLLATLSIWAGIAVSTRSADPRVAAQLSALISLPSVAVTTAVSLGAFHVTLRIALLLGAALLAVDVTGWRLISPLFQREPLVTGSKP